MDWSQVSRSQWMVVGGTVLALIGTLFLDWYSITVNLGPLGSASASVGAWDANSIGKLAVLGSLVMLVFAVLMFLPNAPELPVPIPMGDAGGERVHRAHGDLRVHRPPQPYGHRPVADADRVARRGLRRLLDGRPLRDAVAHALPRSASDGGGPARPAATGLHAP